METNLLMQIVYYGGIGFAEWKLAGRRFSGQMDFEMFTAPMLVVCEGLLAWYVIDQFTNNHDWVIALSASVGGGFGLYSEMRRRRAAKQKERDNGQEHDCRCAGCAAFVEKG